MSKLCTRNFKDNIMLATEKIRGVECCTLCKKPTLCHGVSIADRAAYWGSSDDTGISSKALLRHMMYMPENGYSMPPSDADDRGRCIRLLELIPEWIPRLQELAKDEKPSNGIVISASGISADTNSWAKQIPLIIKEGKF
jgi:hypothetical protein